ncbi:MAG: LysM peptidoglycan-binding domain-containing protein, partial [Proteobacteria bacterium]|nr:LysM peptidoglycan-binding domain-containing protein [Pseudomonadota bacterium]
MKWAGWLMVVLLACFLSACRTGWAPLEQRTSGRTSYQLTKDGHYRVRKGDSLHAIAFNYGLDWRDIAGWNHISAPYLIYPDQELRLTPPRSYSQVAPPRAAGSKISSQPRSSIAGEGRNPSTWMWPTSGRITSNYKANDSSKKGIDISGKEG